LREREVYRFSFKSSPTTNIYIFIAYRFLFQISDSERERERESKDRKNAFDRIPSRRDFQHFHKHLIYIGLYTES